MIFTCSSTEIFKLAKSWPGRLKCAPVALSVCFFLRQSENKGRQKCALAFTWFQTAEFHDYLLFNLNINLQHSLNSISFFSMYYLLHFRHTSEPHTPPVLDSSAPDRFLNTQYQPNQFLVHAFKTTTFTIYNYIDLKS